MTENFGDCHGFYDTVDDYMEHPRHDKPITENFVGGHDPVVEYVDNIYSNNGWLCLYSKDQIFLHNLFPLSPSFLVKHDEGSKSLDHLLDWIHWKS